MLYIVSYGINRMIPKLKLTWVTGAAAGAAVMTALFAFHNELQVFVFDRFWTPISFVFQIRLPAILLLFVRKRKKPPTVSAAEAEQESL